MTKPSGSEMLVVGGGIGGLATALAAARSGWSVRVLERSTSFGEIGAGIQLAPNATRFLAQLGLLEQIVDVGVLPRRLVLRNAVSGMELTALDLGDGFLAAYGAPYVVLHRGDLLAIMVDACTRHPDISLEACRDVTEVSPTPDAVAVDCAGGIRYSAGAVVGADGLWSTIRRRFSDDEPICSGFVSYRGAVPLDSVAEHPTLDEVVAWIGPGLHFVQYPLRRTELYNQVAVFRSDEYFAGEDDWGNPDELDRRFATTCPQIRAALPALRRDNRWPMYDREPIPKWTDGRVALVGDAAHPMLQYLAQGACQAFEDAAALGTALRRHTPGGAATDVPAAFSAYEQARRAPATRVQQTARVWGDIWHVDGVGALLRDELLTQRAGDDRRHIDWLYGAPAPA
ncbi:MAG: FAD-dependent monooxygenase [Actinomycetes bacterium]